jgi:Pyruvate/2-oxoglutarate dehydrogenase complex, dihydrolipoamide dehydrogenase (E3) component, and related enzymes
MREIDVAVIGGGSAGLAAAAAAYEAGCTNILILEREPMLGGILQQCIHNGFGLHVFKEELTGPEYAQRYIDRVKQLGIPYLTYTMVLEIGRDRVLTAMNPRDGLIKIKAKAIVMATGCRERPRGALNMAGARAAGIYTAGTAQKLLNQTGYMPGTRVVVLGSGDIGLIMARRFTLQGAKVEAVAEIRPYAGGLARNVAQCLEDFDIPLYLSHTVTEIKGNKRVEGVTIAQVDENYKPKKETERYIPCDTLLLSVGLIPENELARGLGIELSSKTKGAVVNEQFETSADGIFECGNALHVHDLVDNVTLESEKAGRYAAGYVLGIKKGKASAEVADGEGVFGTVPQRIYTDAVFEPITLMFRPSESRKNVDICVYADGKKIASARRLIVVPGEMAEIKLKPEVIPGEAKTITVTLEGGEK